VRFHCAPLQAEGYYERKYELSTLDVIFINMSRVVAVGTLMPGNFEASV
jgi:hypothetical protein